MIVRPINSDPDILRLSDYHNSWVAERNGQYFLKSSVLAEVLKNTYVLNIFMFNMYGARYFKFVGDSLYEQVANKRTNQCNR